MYPYIQNEKLIAAAQAAADSLGVTLPVFLRAVYDYKQKEYDREDIIQWLEEEGYAYNDDDVDYILDILRDEYDANQSTWSNISSAYDRTGMHLHQVDEDDEDGYLRSLDEKYFPQCLRCAHREECEAHNKALCSVMESQVGITPDCFVHELEDCESFEEVEDCEACGGCSATCALHADCPVANARANSDEVFTPGSCETCKFSNAGSDYCLCSDDCDSCEYGNCADCGKGSQ